MGKKRLAKGTKVMVCNLPWRGVVGTIEEDSGHWPRYRVLLGDFVSGGTQRIVTCSKVKVRS